MNMKCKGSEIFLVEEERYAKKFKKSRQSVFQLVFQKQGLKQLYQPLRKGVQSCTKKEKDEGR